MRQTVIDFECQSYPLWAGYLGEHNATEIVVTKPADLSGAMYSLAFMTNGEVIHSKYFSANEEIKVALWQQLTQDNDLYVQLEAYDEYGDYLGKSAMVKLILSNSAHGTDVVADADNPDVYAEIAQNSIFRETLEDNVDALDKLTLSEKGKLLFDGKPIESGGTGGGLTEEQEKNIELNTEARHTHDNKSVLDKFGINEAKTRPTFGGTTQDYVLATQGDVTKRVNEHRTEVLELISAIPKFAIAVVDELPTENISATTVYLVRDNETDGNLYTEYIYINNAWECLGSQSVDVDLAEYYTKPEADAIFAKKADIPTDESYELIGQTPLTLENGGNIKLVADGEAAYEVKTPTVWNFDDFFASGDYSLAMCSLVREGDHYKVTSDNATTAHYQSYLKILIPVEAGKNYTLGWDSSASKKEPENTATDWGGRIYVYDGESTSSLMTGVVLFDETNYCNLAPQTNILQVRYYPASTNTTAPKNNVIARFNSLWLNEGEATDLTEPYEVSGSFTGSIVVQKVPKGAIITAEPISSVYRKSPTDKTLTQGDVPADAEVTGKEITKIKSYLPLFGKTIVNFGDSIFGNAQPPDDVSTFLAEKTGATVYNCGFGGCRMSQHVSAWDAFSMYNLANSIANGDYTLQETALESTEVDLPDRFTPSVERLKGIDFSKVDIVTIAYGTNDFTSNIAIDNEDNPYDTTTLAGALRYSVEQLLTAYPNVRIFVVSTTYRFWIDSENDNAFLYDSNTHTNTNNVKLTDYNAKLKEVAEEYNLPFIDNYNIGIGKFNRTQYFSATDGTHHQIEGRKLIAERLAGALSSVPNSSITVKDVLDALPTWNGGAY